MPRQLPARLENQSRSPQSPNGQPSSEFRGMEIFASQFERSTSRQLHTRPRLYKRCAASARRKNCASSLGLRCGEELNEAGIFTKRVPERVDPKIAHCFSIGHFEKVRERGDGRIQIAEVSLELGESDFGLRFR